MVLVGFCGGSWASANVFNMPGGLTSLEWVTVGDPGNVDDPRGGYGGVDHVYNIGKYEVTNAQYCELLNAVAASDPHGLYSEDMGGGWNGIGGITRSDSSGTYTYSIRPNRGNRPVNYVSFDDARRFANWLHNGQPTGPQDASTTEDGVYDMSLGSSRKPGAQMFLPSEDEWYKAAYYKGGGIDAGYWDYPTQCSDSFPISEVPPGTNLVNGSANYCDDGGYVDPTYYTTVVGAYDAKPSDTTYGTFDQGGNVGEWNETFIQAPNRGFRGGSFDAGLNALHAEFRIGVPPTFEDDHTGFRVAAVPEPATLGLLALGALAALRRKR